MKNNFKIININGVPYLPAFDKALRSPTLTCTDCLCRASCAFVDDLYNTAGDCLADK